MTPRPPGIHAGARGATPQAGTRPDSRHPHIKEHPVIKAFEARYTPVLPAACTAARPTHSKRGDA